MIGGKIMLPDYENINVNISFRLFKKLLPEGVYSENVAYAIYKFFGELSDGMECWDPIDDALADWKTIGSYEELLDTFSDVFSYQDYCSAMNMDADEFSRKEFEQAMDRAFFIAASSPMDDGRWIYREKILDDVKERFALANVFHNYPTIVFEDQVGENITTQQLECIDAKGQKESISFKTNQPLQAIIVKEPLYKVNLDALFYPWVSIEKTVEEKDLHDEFCYLNFFGQRLTFNNKLEIYDASQRVAVFGADLIKLYRYGECGCIIHLIESAEIA